MSDFCSTCAEKHGLPQFDIRAEPGQIIYDLCEGCGYHWFDENGVRRGNIRLSYLYRDADNYKQHSEVLFPNLQRGYTEKEVEQVVMACLYDGEWFKAEQVGLPVCFFDGKPGDADHCWHEFEFVEETDNSPTDPRDIEEFLEAMRKAHQNEWR
jgi:hypothetical protein